MTETKDEISPQYEPTSQERRALLAQNSRKVERTAPRLKVVKNGHRITFDVQHADKSIGWALLMEALGTADPDFIDGLLRQIADPDSLDGQVDEDRLNSLVAVIREYKPRNHLETMLLAQMAATHELAMAFAQRLPQLQTLQEQDSAERAFNKLTRTYAMQIETLRRYRIGNEPQIMVHNVSVSDGGQAIVGNVTQATSGTTVPSAPALANSRPIPMPTLRDLVDAPGIMQQREINDDGASA